MKKQDANGVRTAMELERKYRFQDIEKAEAQARAAAVGLRNKLDILEYETDIQNYVLISSELTEEDIIEILEGEE